MPIYENINGVRKKARLAVYNNKYLKQIYYGNKLVFQMNKVIFESNTPGTYTINIPLAGYYSIQLVGGGGGGAHARWGVWNARYTGGSAAYVSGNLYVPAGVYTVVVGGAGNGVSTADTGQYIYAGNGGNTSFANQVAGGGYGAWARTGSGDPVGANGGGGTYTVSGGVTGQNGSAGSTSGWINNYGAGGNNSGGNGTVGYAKIQFLYYE